MMLTVRRSAVALGAALALLVAVAPMPSRAQSNTQAELEKYRQMLGDGNPAELLVMRGEGLWKTRRGPKQASLEGCDLGKGPGVVPGAYAELPRYFADTDSVMDAEARIVHCMVTLQGVARADAVRNPYSGAGQRQTDLADDVGRRQDGGGDEGQDDSVLAFFRQALGRDHADPGQQRQHDRKFEA